MQIDVIVPVYNRASVVKRALDSVLQQSYKHFHLTIVNDGSTDGTPDILNQYSDRPQVTIIHQKNAGVSSARNAGVKSGKHEWIAFLDSDDEWLPHKLQTQIHYLEKNGQCPFVHSEEIWMRKGVRVNPKVKHSKSSDNIFERSLDFCLISPSTVLMKRSLFERLGGFDPEFVVCEDYDLWLKVLALTDIGFINENLAIKYGGDPDQLSTMYPAMDYWRIKSLVRLHENMLEENMREKIKKVINQKAQILLPGYQKHNNKEAFDEITALMLSVK